MSEQDPKRLLHGGGELRALLEAGKSEVPSDGQMMLLAAKIGILGGIGGAGAAGAAGAGGAGAAGAGGVGGAGAGAAKTAVAVGAVKAGLAVKVIGAVAIAGAAGAGAVAVSQKDVTPTQAPVGIVASTSTSASTSGGGSTSTSGGGSASASASVSVSTSASDEAPVVSAPKANVRPAGEPKDDGPQAEVKLLERAQDALRSRPAEALALCNDHAQRFPGGMLVQEREVIAIEALIKTGRKDEARRRADRFKARFPGSSHTRRLDALLGG